MLLIHRPRYGDWSFPKGKVKEDAARATRTRPSARSRRRSASAAALGPELESTSYRDSKGRKKTVRYWAMELPLGSEPIAGDGVDEWRWAPFEEAADDLTWDRDRAVLASLPVEELV